MTMVRMGMVSFVCAQNSANFFDYSTEWHDLFTDSMINFETVKHFTAENYELGRFRNAVNRYQMGSVHVQGSLSFLNVSQKLLFQTCMATSLSLAVWGIEQRISCCTETVGCESALSDCCRNVSSNICPGMEVGDFVAVLTYLVNLFAPLDFLGTVYNAVVMAMIDLASLSELLAENPDVVDAEDAVELPLANRLDPDTAVEFDNVFFRYPTQPENKGLQGVSFKMKRGTTTAIVGPTGEFYSIHLFLDCSRFFLKARVGHAQVRERQPLADCCFGFMMYWADRSRSMAQMFVL